MGTEAIEPKVATLLVERQERAVKQLHERLVLERLRLTLLKRARDRALWLETMGWNSQPDLEQRSAFTPVGRWGFRKSERGR